MKWLFWGGIIGTTASLAWRMIDKRRMERTRNKYKLVRNMATKTMRGIKENIGELINREYKGLERKKDKEELKKQGRYLDRKLVGTSRWLRENKTKWD